MKDTNRVILEGDVHKAPHKAPDGAYYIGVTVRVEGVKQDCYCKLTKESYEWSRRAKSKWVRVHLEGKWLEEGVVFDLLRPIYVGS